MSINNNSMYTELIEATNMMLGESAIDTLDLQGIIDIGQTWDFSQKEQWANALSARYVKSYYTDSAYTDSTNDVFFEDAASFGAIAQTISIEMPEVIASRNWETVTSGTTTIGSNVVYLPIVNEKLFGSTCSWSVPIAFTGTQLNAAFENVEQLRQFDMYVRLAAENSVNYHREVMNSMNRNNYIAEKINIGNSDGKINVVNLVEEYAKYRKLDSLTAETFLHTEACNRYAVKTFKKYKGLLKSMSTLFTTDTNSHGKFVPENRLVFQVLNDYEALFDMNTMSEVYHNEFVKMPLHRTVTAWQGLTNDTASAEFEQLSSIDIKNASGDTVTKSGIVGFMCDKWAIMHTIVQQRVGVQRDDIKDITLNDYQFTDRYMNNLSLNGVVFVLEDYTKTETT